MNYAPAGAKMWARNRTLSLHLICGIHWRFGLAIRRTSLKRLVEAPQCVRKILSLQEKPQIISLRPEKPVGLLNVLLTILRNHMQGYKLAKQEAKISLVRLRQSFTIRLVPGMRPGLASRQASLQVLQMVCQWCAAEESEPARSRGRARGEVVGFTTLRGW